MKIYFALFLVFFVGMMSSCSRKATQMTEKTQQPTSVKEVPKPVVPKKPKKAKEAYHATLLLSIKRNPCYGKCPWYEAELYDDGMIVYHGKKNVQHVGDFVIHTKPKTVRSIVDQAQKNGFFTMSSSYPVNPKNKIPDLPITTLMVKLGRTSKTITMQNEIPVELLQYVQDIEGLLKRMDFSK